MGPTYRVSPRRIIIGKSASGSRIRLDAGAIVPNNTFTPEKLDELVRDGSILRDGQAETEAPNPAGPQTPVIGKSSSPSGETVTERGDLNLPGSDAPEPLRATFSRKELIGLTLPQLREKMRQAGIRGKAANIEDAIQALTSEGADPTPDTK